MSRFHRLFTVVTLALTLIVTGCATVQDGRVADPESVADVIANIKADVKIDLAAALAIAQEANDQEGVLCYTALIKHFGTQTPTGTQVKGVFSAFEKARVTRKAFGGGVPTELKIGCAPLLMDERLFVLRLGLLATPAGGVGSLLK